MATSATTPGFNKLTSQIDTASKEFSENAEAMAKLVYKLREDELVIKQGGGDDNIAKQHQKKRLTARERIELLLDKGSPFFELGLFVAYQMYEEWGGAPASGAVAGIGRVQGRQFMIIANDATVKAGAFFPMTAKKVIRAQTVALENHIPTIYLVDSAGIFLPLQEDVFPTRTISGASITSTPS